jgi:hypothetical protein
MCTGTVFQQWQADAILELKNHGHQPVLLIIDGRPAQKISRFRQILKKRWGTIVYSLLENRVFKPEAKRPVDMRKDLRDPEVLNCMVVKRGYSEYFGEDDIAAVRSRRLDFILRFGFNIIRGEILSAARFGVWSFHHDDEMIYRGGPPGFWEIFQGDPVSGAIMQRLTDKLDGGAVLQKGYLKTVMHSYRENLGQLLSVSSSWPARVADELSTHPGDADGADFLINMPASHTTAQVCKVPGNLQMLKFLFLLMRNRIRFYYRELISAEIWNVGVIMKPIHEVALGKEKLLPSEVTWLPRVNRSGYLADPFGFMEGDRLRILAENYDYATQRAGIAGISWEPGSDRVIHPDGVIRPDEAKGGAPHLSYPFVFEHNSTVYCLPESYQSSQITLFRRLPEGEFVKDRVLLADVSAVDPTLFFYNGFWWLFFTDRKYSNTHLSVYFSEELTGEFKPHRINPVKTDIRSARPAGTPFIHEHVLYRPAQDCSATYGGRVAVNRIVRLTPDDFAEETVNFIEPVSGSLYDQGLHTLSAVGNITLIDGKRYEANRLFFTRQLGKKLNSNNSDNV